MEETFFFAEAPVVTLVLCGSRVPEAILPWPSIVLSSPVEVDVPTGSMDFDEDGWPCPPLVVVFLLVPVTVLVPADAAKGDIDVTPCLPAPEFGIGVPLPEPTKITVSQDCSLLDVYS